MDQINKMHQKPASGQTATTPTDQDADAEQTFTAPEDAGETTNVENPTTDQMPQMAQSPVDHGAATEQTATAPVDPTEHVEDSTTDQVASPPSNQKTATGQNATAESPKSTWTDQEISLAKGVAAFLTSIQPWKAIMPTQLYGQMENLQQQTRHLESEKDEEDTDEYDSSQPILVNLL